MCAGEGAPNGLLRARAVTTDAAVTSGSCRRFGQADETVLGRGVGGLAGEALDAGAGRGDDDEAAAAPERQLDLVLHGHERAKPARQIPQVLSEAQNDPTTNWPGLIV